MTTCATGNKPSTQSKLSRNADDQRKRLHERITGAPLVVLKALATILSAVP